MPHSELAVRQPAELAAGIFQCAGRNVRRSRAQLLGADDAYLATDCGTINSRAACRLASAVSRANSDSPARLCEPPVYPPTRRSLSLSLSLSHTRARAHAGRPPYRQTINGRGPATRNLRGQHGNVSSTGFSRRIHA